MEEYNDTSWALTGVALSQWAEGQAALTQLQKEHVPCGSISLLAPLNCASGRALSDCLLVPSGSGSDSDPEPWRSSLSGVCTLSLPCSGPGIAAGPIIGLIVGALTHADGGSLESALIAAGAVPERALSLASKFRSGSLLVLVHAPRDSIKRWEQVLSRRTDAAASTEHGRRSLASPELLIPRARDAAEEKRNRWT